MNLSIYFSNGSRKIYCSTFINNGYIIIGFINWLFIFNYYLPIYKFITPKVFYFINSGEVKGGYIIYFFKFTI